MFKRLLAWLGLIKPKTGIPANARYVTVSGGDRGANKQMVLVVPPESKVVVEPVRRIEGDVMSRQDWLMEYGDTPFERRAKNRAWTVSRLPDECAFL